MRVMTVFASACLTAGAAFAEPKVVHVMTEVTPRTGSVELSDGRREIPVVVGMPSFCTAPFNPVCSLGVHPTQVRQTTTRTVTSIGFDPNRIPENMRNHK